MQEKFKPLWQVIMDKISPSPITKEDLIKDVQQVKDTSERYILDMLSMLEMRNKIEYNYPKYKIKVNESQNKKDRKV